MARKTVPVADVVAFGNNMLAHPSSTRTQRASLIVLIEHVLFDTDNYRGYSYLASEFLPAEQQTNSNVLRPDYDETRRQYSLPA